MFIGKKKAIFLRLEERNLIFNEMQLKVLSTSPLCRQLSLKFCQKTDFHRNIKLKFTFDGDNSVLFWWSLFCDGKRNCDRDAHF